MQGLPASLRSAVSKINISKNTFKLVPNNAEIDSSSILTVNMPTNGLASLKSLFLSAQLAVEGQGVAPPKYLPIFSKIIVEFGGRALHSCSHLDVVTTIMNQMALTKEERQKKVVYGNVNVPTIAAAAASFNEKIIIDDFPGFISSSSTQILDLSLLPDMKIHFYLTDGKNFVKTSTATGTGAYKLTNVYFSVDTLSVDDNGDFYKSYDSHLKSGGEVNVVFDNWLTSLNSTTQDQTTSFSVNTNSMDLMIGCQMPNHGVLGGKDAVTGTSDYYTRVGSNIDKFNFEVNSINYPIYPASKSDAYPLALNAITHGCAEDGLASATAWENNYWLAAYSMELPRAEGDHQRLVSGYNTISTGARMSFTTSATGTAGNTKTFLAVKCSSILKVGANKSLDIIS